jgi:hypothetical protein
LTAIVLPEGYCVEKITVGGAEETDRVEVSWTGETVVEAEVLAAALV